MNKGVLIAALIALTAVTMFYVQESKQVDAFEQWKLTFGTPFAAEEQLYRRLIFEKNLLVINSHNADKTQTYKMGINQFSIYSDEQFKSRFLSEMIVPETQSMEVITGAATPIVGDIDWVSQGKVSPVKNQGSCGSCWAFSTTGVLESQSLQKGTSVNLSEQQLVDCSRAQGNQGCSGGWPSNALKYISAYGITTQSAYPYAAVNQACKTNGGSFKISGQDSHSSCAGLQNRLNASPISVTVDATNWSKYSSGLFSNCAASINHAVLLVGIVGGNWKIKNSWGTGWGESGYIRLTGSGSTCGLCSYPGVTGRL